MFFQLLQIKSDTLTHTSHTIYSFNLNGWFLLCLLELLIIIFLIFKKLKSKNYINPSALEMLMAEKHTNVDMADLMLSINNASDLYKELSRMAHPDKFVNTEKEKIAEELFKEVEANRRNYKNLVELKQRISLDLYN